MDDLLFRAGGWLLIAMLAVLAIAVSADFGFSVHMAIVAAAALGVMVLTLRNADYYALNMPGAGRAVDQSRYDDEPIRWGVIATMFWGVAGLAAGLYIALQLAFPVLNLGLEYTSFGRLRPLHTSAVI